MKALAITLAGAALIAAGGCARDYMRDYSKAYDVQTMPAQGVDLCESNSLIVLVAVDSSGNVGALQCPYVLREGKRYPISVQKDRGANMEKANAVPGVVLADVVKWKMKDDPD
ncbi:MAG: hypothetical protein ACREH3_18640, partial [Geminicoccales bacterium]